MADVTEMEEYLREQYEQAQKDIRKKMKDYLQQFKRLDAAKRKAVEEGKITEDEYKQWKLNKILYNNHWKRLSKNIAQDLTRVNELAVKYINGEVPDIFINAYNSLEKDIPAGPVEGYSFELINKETVEGLVKRNEIILPPPKDINKYKDNLWNTKNVNTAVLQGILQGESMDAIAVRVAAATAEKNLNTAIRNARTMVTAAENSGRDASIKQAEKEGVILDKIWRATSDSRTRDSHAKMDGERVPSEKPFSNGLMFPADWRGRPEEVYNCRCTLITKFVSFDNKRFKEYRHTKKLEQKREERKNKLSELRDKFQKAANNMQKESIVNEAGDVVREEFMEQYDQWQEQNKELTAELQKRLDEIEEELERVVKEYAELDHKRDIARVNGDGLALFNLNFDIEVNRNNYALLNAERNVTTAKIDDIIDERKEKLPKIIQNILSQYRDCGYGGMNPDDFFKPKFFANKKYCKIVADSLAVYPTDWIRTIQENKASDPSKPKHIKVGFSSRGLYNGKEIILDGKTDRRNRLTGIHENMHYIEDNVSMIEKIDSEFFFRRTDGYPVETLNDLYSTDKFDDDEIAIADKFIEPYIGKIYATDGYEILSMGYEMMFSEPEKLLKDTDYFNHLLGVFLIC